MAPTVYVEELAASGMEDAYSAPPASFAYIDCLLQGVGRRALHSRQQSHRTLKLHKWRRARAGTWRLPLLAGSMATDTAHDDDTRVTASSTDSSGSGGSDGSNNATGYRAVTGAGAADRSASPLRAYDKTAAWVEDSAPEQERCRQRLQLLRRREGLLDITMRTVALMRRNERLQLQLSALQEETRAFVRSVLDNPENRRPEGGGGTARGAPQPDDAAEK
ncbi:uncharacterized protein LOC134532727 [Bacillus rossius redtenbacheri]|uniref:uncharacterized protein LOC134532727 n=1 Tax=Bacillus rossius redtenbacheri TaxID=93214 RepID=UPI002FDE12B6